MTSALIEILLPFAMYTCIFISGFTVPIAIGLTKNALNDTCPLFLEFGYKVYFTPTRSIYCDYIIYLTVATFIAYGFMMLVLYLYAFYRSFSIRSEPVFFMKVIELVLNIIIWILVFVAACIASAGRSKTCSNFLTYYPTHDSCYAFEKSISVDRSIIFENSIKRTVLAEVTLWMSLIWWTFLIVPSSHSILKKIRNPKSSYK